MYSIYIVFLMVKLDERLIFTTPQLEIANYNQIGGSYGPNSSLTISIWQKCNFGKEKNGKKWGASEKGPL